MSSATTTQPIAAAAAVSAEARDAAPTQEKMDSRKPVQLAICPNCAEQNVTTDTKSKVTGATLAAVGVGALVFWPLSWVPLVSDSLKETTHYCQKCGVAVGKVKPMQAKKNKKQAKK